jgi:hypothetical protein
MYFLILKSTYPYIQSYACEKVRERTIGSTTLEVRENRIGSTTFEVRERNIGSTTLQVRECTIGSTTLESEYWCPVELLHCNLCNNRLTHYCHVYFGK